MIKCQPALKPNSEEYQKTLDTALIRSLETFCVSPKKRRQFYVDVQEGGTELQWYYITDGDIYFGVFYEVSFLVTSVYS